MRLFIILIFGAVVALSQRVEIVGKSNFGTGPISFNVAPPLPIIPAHTWITFDTNSVGDAANTNTVIATMVGWQLTSLTNVNGSSGMAVTNGRANLTALSIGGTTYLPRGSNAFRYNHNSSPAQYIQGRFAHDLDDATVGYALYTSFNGIDAGTYDLMQLQTISDWCSCNLKDENPPKIGAHTDGSPGIGSLVSISPNQWYWISQSITNDTCIIRIYNMDSWAFVGASTNALLTPSAVRFIQFGQFGHTAHDDFTIIDNIVINTNGIVPLGP